MYQRIGVVTIYKVYYFDIFWECSVYGGLHSPPGVVALKHNDHSLSLFFCCFLDSLLMFCPEFRKMAHTEGLTSQGITVIAQRVELFSASLRPMRCTVHILISRLRAGTIARPLCSFEQILCHPMLCVCPASPAGQRLAHFPLSHHCRTALLLSAQHGI